MGGSTMSYDPKLLFEQISVCLNENPRKTLEELAQSLRVSKRTIKKTVRSLTGGNFRHYREEVLMERVKGFFAMQPGAAIKVLSIDLGFKSPGSSRAPGGEGAAGAPEHSGALARAQHRQRTRMRQSMVDCGWAKR